ncbi:aldo/keto reductase family protein [Dongia deserti]|uniref:aldo/keto reductase family protein n=1 Tax=Dongia deserti TaxID=2268030 RepID=UPI000E64A6A0|nr:aldo/keto reductase [Dongia deserti]
MNPQSSVTLHTGNPMPVMGLGTWELTKNTAETVQAAFGLGYRMIDTSADYGTQPGIAEAIKRSGMDRSSVYLVAKIEETDDPYEATREYLDELQSEYADLMLIHRPPPKSAGEQLWRGLMRAKQDGLARDIGVSNYSAEQIETLIDASGEVPAVNQIEWSPFGHSEAMLKYCKERGIVIQAYSPLTRTTRLADDVLAGVASTYEKTPAQVLIRWNLERGAVPLPKANQRSHLEEDIDVFDFDMSSKDVALLTDLNERYSALGSLPYA